MSQVEDGKPRTTFKHRVAIVGDGGRHLYNAPGERAQMLVELGLAKVSIRRRRVVIQVQLVPAVLERIGRPTGEAAHRPGYSQLEHVVIGEERTGHRVFRHRMEVIAGYEDAFLDVVRSVGAGLREDQRAQRRRVGLD